MKRISVFLSVFIMLLCNTTAFSQEEDDVPYLSDEDIEAIEIVLPEDTPNFSPADTEELADKTDDRREANEMPRLNASQPVYHLLILDRVRCRLNSDIEDVSSLTILYKFKHKANGYLIALYKSSREGPVFPILPDGSRILVELISSRKSAITEYINSSAFRRFVTSRRILSQMQRVLRGNI
jgi:hypothetical protein